MKRLRLAVAMSLMTLVLTACGGGGGGDGDPINNPINNPNNNPNNSGLLQLDDSNGGLIATIALLNAKGAANGAIFTGAIDLLNAGFALVGANLTGTGYTETESCSVSGSYTWTFSDNDGDDGISSGDSWLVVNNNCEREDSFTIGSTGFDITTLVSSDITDEYHADITFTHDLSGTLFGDNRRSLGSYTWKSDTPDGIVITQNVMVTSYESIINDEVITMTDLSYIQTTDKNSLAENMAVNGDMSDETLGDYSLETHQTLTAIDPPLLIGDEFYYEGSFTVTLETGSVTLTALSSTDVQLDVDLDGDGMIDQTVNTTWSVLASEYLSHLGFL